MKRGLNCDGIKRRILNLRDANDKISIRTSIIVGFPNETDKDFQDLIDLITEVQFDRLGVFQYSHEENTHAADVMEDNVPKEVKQARFDETMVLQQKINFEKNKSLINTDQKVVFSKPVAAVLLIICFSSGIKARNRIHLICW